MSQQTFKGYTFRQALSNDVLTNKQRISQTIIANMIRNNEFDYLTLSTDGWNGIPTNYPDHLYCHGVLPTMRDKYYVRLSNFAVDGYDHIRNYNTGVMLDSLEVRFMASVMKINIDKNPKEFRRVIFEIEMNVAETKILGRRYYTHEELCNYKKKIWNKTDLFYGSHGLSSSEKRRLVKAVRRSEELLRQWLTKSEYESIINNELKIKSRVNDDVIYIVRKDPAQRVEVLENGIKTKELCVVVDESIPSYDKLLTKILLLKTDENRFLEIAHVWRR